MADEDTEKREKLDHYVVEQDNGVTATYKLTASDAKRMGAKKRPEPSTAVDPAGGKARTAPNK